MTTVQKNTYKYIYKYLTIAISHSYRFLKLNPESLHVLKIPYRAWQFCIPTGF